jgi:hypothetical protein
LYRAYDKYTTVWDEGNLMSLKTLFEVELNISGKSKLSFPMQPNNQYISKKEKITEMKYHE